VLSNSVTSYCEHYQYFANLLRFSVQSVYLNNGELTELLFTDNYVLLIGELFQGNRISQSLLGSYINGIHWLSSIPFLDQATDCAGSLALFI